jgi:N-carbamoyl-L-amino-acid hydrolase
MERASGSTVITVGRIEAQPNAVNVIPGRVTFTIDLRARSDELLVQGDAAVRALTTGIAAERGLACELSCVEELPVVHLDADLCGRLRGGALKLGMELPDAVSGALHDTAVLAPLLPAAMLFVASRGGISHNPQEFSRIEDVASAARIVAETVLA